jgi:hypothetical protein
MGITTATTADKKILLERLRADCDVAFRNWTAQVRVLQSVNSGELQDKGATDEARRWAEEAAAVYREKRNLLLELLMRSRSVGDGHASRMGNTVAGSGLGGSKSLGPVEKLAHQIWEESGRPSGSAEEDWFQAEKILETRR